MTKVIVMTMTFDLEKDPEETYKKIKSICNEKAISFNEAIYEF